GKLTGENRPGHYSIRLLTAGTAHHLVGDSETSRHTQLQASLALDAPEPPYLYRCGSVCAARVRSDARMDCSVRAAPPQRCTSRRAYPCENLPGRVCWDRPPRNRQRGACAGAAASA